MKERQDTQTDVVGADDLAAGRHVLTEIRGQVAMGEHGGLRCAGGAAGEHEAGEIAFGAFDHRGGLDGLSKHVKVDGVGQANPRRAQHVLEGRHDRTIDLLKDTDTGRPSDHGLGPDLGEFTFDLGGRALRVERHGDHARTKDAEPGAHETEIGRAQDCDPVARFESKRDENPARLFDLGGQLPVGDAVAASDDGGAFCGMISEEGREVHSAPSWQVRGPIPPTIRTIFGADDKPENAPVGPEVGLRLSRPARRTATPLRQG